MTVQHIKFVSLIILLTLLFTSCDIFSKNYTYTFDNRSSYHIRIYDINLDPSEFWISPGTVKTAESKYNDLFISNYHVGGNYVSVFMDGKRFIFTDNPEGYKRN